MTGMGRAVYLYLKGLWWGSGGANGDTRTRTYICLSLPQPVVTPPARPVTLQSYWLRHFPTTTPSGINTPHVPSQSFFIHLPLEMEPIEGSETSAIRTKMPGNYPKENILQITFHFQRINNIYLITFTCGEIFKINSFQNINFKFTNNIIITTIIQILAKVWHY